MKGDPEFIILKHSAWLSADKFETQILGSVIRYPLRPTDDYVSGLQHNQQPLVSSTRDDFILDSTSSISSNASATLTSITNVNWKGSVDDSVHLKGKLLTIKRLQQHSQFWASLKNDGKFVSTVPGWISIFNSWQPCLVVGVMIAEDVEIDFSGSEGRERDGKLEVPLTTIATAAAGTPMTAGNVQIQAGRKQDVAGVFRASSGKSEIFAIELRTVTSKWFRRELEMKENGPNVGSGRLHGADDDDEGENEKSVTADDLILEDFTEQDYDELLYEL